MSQSRFTSTLMTVLLSVLCAGFLAPPATASSEIKDHTDDKRMRIEFSQHSRSNSGTITRSRQPSESARSIEAPRSVNNVPRSFAGTSQQAGSESDGPVRSPVCFRGGRDAAAPMSATYLCNMPVLEDLLRTPETNTDPAVPVAQSGPVVQPIEIIITTSDLMELIPSTPQIVMDRGPFGLKNAHTNFYASNHQAQTVTETMFGQEVTIVATPLEYRWDYGDGNTLTTQTPGRPVEIFNVETETSHQFTEPGTYTVTLTTVFEGTYQVDGGPTQAVSSTVTQQAEPVEIEIWRAVTRNVDQTCGQNPQAWGC